MDEFVAGDFIASIEGATDLDDLQKRYFEARDAAEKLGDKKALNAFAETKNRVYKSLAKKAVRS
jgi:hypothetical protein